VQKLLSWVHLSDIQYGHGDKAGHALVMEQLRADIAGAEGRGCLRPDAILVTGDVAFSGAAAEYTAAKEWLRTVGETAGGVDRGRGARGGPVSPLVPGRLARG
jgi:hypothetical protein